MGLLRYNPAHRYSAEAALGHPWVLSRGGAIPRPLDASVGRGAANVAALRRLRTMVRASRKSENGKNEKHRKTSKI